MTALVVAARLRSDEPFTSDRFEVRSPVLDGDEYAYWKALNAAWSDPRPLINVEHDMEFSDELVQGLVDCPHPLCTYPYLCYLRERRFYVYTPTLDGKWVLPGVEWADTSTLGFIKISPEARIRPLRKMIWKFLEHSMCTAVSGFSQINTTGDRGAWHVHWPAIKHYHDYDTEEWSRASDWERFCAEHGEPCHVTPSALAGDIRSVRLDEHRRFEGPIRYGDCWRVEK